MFNISDETFKSFINESLEHHQVIEDSLLELETNGKNETLINQIFRAAHTIKGSAGFLSFESLKKLAHAMENVLGLMRNGELDINEETLQPLFEGADLLKKILDDINNFDKYDTAEVIAKLDSIRANAKSASNTGNGSKNGDSSGSIMSNQEASGSFPLKLSNNEMKNLQTSENGGRFIYSILFPCPDTYDKDGINSIEMVSDLKSMVGIGKSQKVNKSDQCMVEIAVSSTIEPELFINFCKDFYHIEKDRITLITDCIAEIPESNPPPPARANDVEPAENHPADAASELKSENSSNSRKAESDSIRVSLSQLNRLMTLAGELVLTRNALLKKTAEKASGELSIISQQVDTITSELQDAIMATRMQSMGVVFTKYKRIIRDLAQKLNKKIELNIEGEDVELDRSIIEAINDPLLHLVRNSADHGIESIEKRIAAGKKETGKILLKAAHEAGQVIVEIMDDGAGIDPQKIIEKALEKKLYTRKELDSMSRKEIIRIIFKAGFSTAREVTDISGRGVGMDVVVSNLSKVGGTVDIESETGKYTKIIIKLPLTLAIMPSLLVMAGNQRFAIPQVNLVELVRISASDVKKRIEKIGKWPVMRLRGELLPLVRLSDTLEIERTYHDVSTDEVSPDRRENIADRRSPSFEHAENYELRHPRNEPDRRNSRASEVNIVVVAAGAYKYGLIVDQLLDSEEIVVKPLGTHLSNCREYAGATILGDGNVALILDISGVRQTADLASSQTTIETASEINKKYMGNSHDANTYLIAHNGENEQFCIPLGVISRIEKIYNNSITEAGGRKTMHYEGAMIALLSIEDVVKTKPRKPADHAFAVIFKAYGREVGVLVSEIIDIVDSEGQIDSSTHAQPGVAGSIVVDGKVTLLLDMHGIVDLLQPEYKKNVVVKKNGTSTILVAEDSPFFRKQIKSFLEESGYDVLDAEDGKKGFELLTKNADKVNLIITDIEMPQMDGLEMTRCIRSDSRFSSIPILACTSVSGDVAEKRGKEVGLTEYLIKLDREQILERCAYYLRSENAVT